MSQLTLSFKPAIGLYGSHDPSAAIFRDANLIFGTEEERYTREKHADGKFPLHSINACLDFAEVELSDVDTIVLPYDPELVNNQKRLLIDIKRELNKNSHPLKQIWGLVESTKEQIAYRFFSDDGVRNNLKKISGEIPEIKHQSHHRCHAASAFYPTCFEEAVVMTIDGRGEYDSTVVWHGSPKGLKRVRTYEYPNSLGHFFGVVTEFLGYNAFNGEGKIMGLAPYGNLNVEIEETLRSHAKFGADYDVTGLLASDNDISTSKLEKIFEKKPLEKNEEFTQFHKDLARTTQHLLEETLQDITCKYVNKLNVYNVALAGGVALNCKANKRVRELDCVDDMFVQPVAHDAGLALGGGWLEFNPTDVDSMTDIYWGPDSSNSQIVSLLEKNKLPYKKPDCLTDFVAKRLANGDLVGWFQGRQEMGPRALGNRSILADPRTEESRDRVNKFVKHREEWRPFAPSILESSVKEYLIDGKPSPYMIQTFDTNPEAREDIEAVIHPGDNTTRPQTVRKDQNEKYYELISKFESITGVPVILNTSFNDHGEPIVTTPKEAIKDFYGMGLDILVLNDFVVIK